MDSFYLLDYLKENTKIDKSKIDLLRYELDQRIYFYGKHFKYPQENLLEKKDTIVFLIKSILKNVYIYSSILKNKKTSNKKNILSNAYFSVNEELIKQGFNVLRPMHNIAGSQFIAGDLKIYRRFSKINHIIRSGNFKNLISENFFYEIDAFINQLIDYYKYINITSLVVPNDLCFFEQINIEVFKKLKKPSFVFLHGVPCRYNIHDENQTDYLIVWGKRFKEHYVNIGFNQDKILISGHPFYKELSNHALRNSMDNILVLSKTLNGAQFRDRIRLYDRGNIILYLYSIEKVLKSLGIKRVKLRTHPSENIHWYYQFIDKDFFIEDKDPLSASLTKSSLVIGPTSTVFLESIYYGVNYLVYEPSINNLDLTDFKLVPPFDGSDIKVPVAKDEDTLKQMIKERALVDSSIFHDYIDTPFDISCITERI